MLLLNADYRLPYMYHLKLLKFPIEVVCTAILILYYVLHQYMKVFYPFSTTNVHLTYNTAPMPRQDSLTVLMDIMWRVLLWADRSPCDNIGIYLLFISTVLWNTVNNMWLFIGYISSQYICILLLIKTISIIKQPFTTVKSQTSSTGKHTSFQLERYMRSCAVLFVTDSLLFSEEKF